jgi:putative transposase
MNGPSSASDCGTKARSRPHYGYQRLQVLLRREGWLVNHKLVYRLYCEEGLGIQRTRRQRGKSCQVRQARSPSAEPNNSWSMDFLSDQLFSGKRLRVLTLVDNFSRVSMAIRAGLRLTGDDVVQTVDAVVKSRGAKPASIRVDNGPEFNSKSLDL